MDSTQLTAILGWCTVLNMGFLAFVALLLMAAGGPLRRIHASMYHLPEEDLSRAYFQYLAQYKSAIFIFNLVPYVALRIVGQ